MCQKQGFFNILKDFVINIYWICSIMKIYIICCVPVQIPYLGKFWFLRYGPKCFQPVRLQDFLIYHISRTNQRNAWFCRCWYKFTKIKSWSKFFWMGMARKGCGQSGHRILKLAVSQKWINWMNWFFAWWCKFRKAKSYFNNFLGGREQK